MLPVKYGTNISTVGSIDSDGIISLDARGNGAYKEVSGRTLPIDMSGKRFYKCAYENPHPEKTVVGFRYVPLPDKKDVRVILNRVNLV